MYRFNIIITESCNANCSHCYMGNNKNPKSMTKKEIETIISKIPNNTESVVLTGGEIFLHKDLLFYAIKKLKEYNNKITIKLESNGIYFYKNFDLAKEKLIELKNIGVESIRFSDDPFHSSGGIDLEKVRNLKKLEDNKTPLIKYLVQDKALAIGKGKELNIKEVENRNCMNNQKTVENPYFFVDVKGNIYICTWKCIPPIGNILKEDMNIIIDRLNEKFNNLILQGKIIDAMSLINNNDHSEFVKKHGECLLCDKIFKLDEGKIQDKGTHFDLLKTNKYYKKLCETELIEKANN